VLAGLGISDERGITLEEIEEAKDADMLFIELYTNIWHGSIERLEKLVGKRIDVLKRKDLEEDVDRILNFAIDKKIIIFVPGDPLVATTHTSIILECIKRGIEVKIIHNSSIFSAVCATGLHIYKFGQSITIPLREKIVSKVDSILNIVKENKKRGLHTLCLLDIDVENNSFLTVGEGIKFLIENDLIKGEDRLIVASCLGTKNERIVWKEAKHLLFEDFKLPAVIVIPGDLHFSEKEFLENI